jgi:putative FmdB family regulatory protein
MPFYEYQCKSCGHDLEAMQKVNDPPLRKCPHCGKSQLQRLMSAPVFRLKGGGWYETDFKGDGDTKKNLADKPEADAPKDAAKEAGKDGGKDAAVTGAAGAGGATTGAAGAAGAGAGGAKGRDGKAADGAAAKESGSLKDRGDKPAVKAPVEAAKKPAMSTRGRSVPRGRAAAKRPVKKPAPKAKRR